MGRSFKGDVYSAFIGRKVGYDKNDNVVSVTDPRSKIWSYGFDSLNRLISETEPGTGTVTTGLNGIDEVTSYTDRRNLVTSYVRNGFGETIRETNPDTGITDYTYDSRGLVTQIKDARNVIANMTYDAAGRMLTRAFPAATTENVTFAYDSVAAGNKGKGQLTQLTDPAGSSAFVYDVRGNLLSETRTIGTVSYAVKYTYDGADRLTSITYPSGRIITYVRNAQGKITGVTSKANATATAITLASNVAWQPNVAGAVSGETVFGQGGIATATQNMALPSSGGLGEVDLLQSLTYGNGLVLFKNFTTDNELYQLIVEQTPSTPAGIRINRFYNRADNTNITGIADGQTPANDETYTYTDAGRLAGATSSTTASYGTRSWTYDANGNRLTETANGVLQNYYYGANDNRLSNIAQGSVSKRIFTYDAAGNVTQDLKNSTNAYNYAINNAGRIRTLSIGTTLKTTYTYDGFQRLRVKAQTTPVSTTHYIWDSFGHIIAEHASAGATLKEYIWLGDTPLAVFEGANLFYVHPDNLDRPVMMTNPTQTIAWQAKYDPFGNPVTITSAITNNQRLPGQYFQIEDGLSYNWHRTYDPTIGRYTQADPLGFVDGPSVYGYSGSSPIMRVDPRGQFMSFLRGRPSLDNCGPVPEFRPPFPRLPPNVVKPTPPPVVLAGATTNFNSACKLLKVDRNKASKALHQAKQAAGLGGADNCVFDTGTGDILHNGESIGNLQD